MDTNMITDIWFDIDIDIDMDMDMDMDTYSTWTCTWTRTYKCPKSNAEKLETYFNWFAKNTFGKNINFNESLNFKMLKPLMLAMNL